LIIGQRPLDEEDGSNGGAETTTGLKKKSTPVKAATSTTKNHASNNDDESRDETTNDEDSNSVDPASINSKNRKGKPTSTDAGASGNIIDIEKKRCFKLISFQVILRTVEITKMKMRTILMMMTVSEDILMENLNRLHCDSIQIISKEMGPM
jgi:hypothetical protein